MDFGFYSLFIDHSYLITFCMIGLVVGFLAMWLVPNTSVQGNNLITSMIIGILGSILGNYLANRLSFNSIENFSSIKVGISILVSSILVFIYRTIRC